MRKLTVISLVVASVLAAGCGGGSSSAPATSGDSSAPATSGDSNNNGGSGTENDPYQIGAGEYKIQTGTFYTFSTTKDNCKVVTYEIDNIALTITDETLQTVREESGFSFNHVVQSILQKGKYNIKARKTGNKYAEDIGAFGIASNCTDISTFEIRNISSGVTNLSYTDGLYKINMNEAGTVLIRGTNTAEFVFYDEDFNLIDSSYEDELTTTLQKGVNYVFVWHKENAQIYFEYN